MIVPAGTATDNDPPILHAAIGLAGEIDAASTALEQERRLPRNIASAMKDAGIFGMAMPRQWGGLELDPWTQFRIIEALAMANGSVGWCAMINCDSGYASAFLDQDVARAMYSDVNMATGSTVTPVGVAGRVANGYRVSGRFPFVSGVHHCDWVFVGCVVTEDGASHLNEHGVPETRQCFLRPSEFEILDTWHTSGLRGTGSHHIAVNDVMVPAERTFSFQDRSIVKRSGPLYSFPLLFTAKLSAPALGIARRAVDFVIDQARSKKARQYRIGDHLEPPKKLAEDIHVQEAIVRANAILLSARAYAFQIIGELWETLVEARQPSPALLSHFEILYSHVGGTCVEAVQLVCKAAGGAAVYQGVLDRCLRDVLAANQHTRGSARHYESAGRLLFGLDPLTPLM